MIFLHSKEKLVKAVKHRNHEEAWKQLKGGVDPNAKDIWKLPVLIKAVWLNDVQMINLLIAFNADVNARSMFDSTALIEAARLGHDYVVRILIAQGADIHATDSSGTTAYAAAEKHDRKECMEILSYYSKHKTKHTPKGPAR